MTECEATANHNHGPAGYLAWHEWVERMEATHTQKQCPACRLWCIWEPKPAPAPLEQT